MYLGGLWMCFPEGHVIDIIIPLSFSKTAIKIH